MRTLLMGIGNVLLSDDGIGVHVVRALEPLASDGRVAVRDGGTLGLTLLNELYDIDALIVVDAMQLDDAPGTVREFEAERMDAQLVGKRRSVHEVALADLLVAAALTRNTPMRRALVAVQPQSTAWGTTPTAAVDAAIPVACRAVRALLDRWGVP